MRPLTFSSLALGGVAAALVLVRCGGDDSGFTIPLPDGSADTATAMDATSCAAGKTSCGGTCIDTTGDPKNCGGCGTTCAAKAACVASTCVPCSQIDADKDGYDACTDCDDQDPNVNPGAFDVPGSGKDWDCDGKDDVPDACETVADGGSIASDTTDPSDLAHAMEMCDPWLQSSKLVVVASDKAHQVASDWGLFKPRAGTVFTALSNGVAADVDDLKPAFVPGETPQPGTSFGAMGVAYPLPLGATSCVDLGTMMPKSLPDPATVNDYTELRVTLKVPTNAHSFQLDIGYLSSDSPEWNCTTYDDQALVIVDSQAVKGNVLFDGEGRKMSVNNGFFTLTTAGALTGTGMDQPAGGGGDIMGGGTGWLTMRVPATPKDTVTLRFIVFDSVDQLFDSQLLADHFRWSTDTLACASTTRADGSSEDGGTPSGCTAPVDGGAADASGD